jgi:hypothetical protein
MSVALVILSSLFAHAKEASDPWKCTWTGQLRKWKPLSAEQLTAYITNRSISNRAVGFRAAVFTYKDDGTCLYPRFDPKTEGTITDRSCKYKVGSDGSICATFDDGSAHCDRIVDNGIRYLRLDPKNDDLKGWFLRETDFSTPKGSCEKIPDKF